MVTNQAPWTLKLASQKSSEMQQRGRAEEKPSDSNWGLSKTSVHINCPATSRTPTGGPKRDCERACTKRQVLGYLLGSSSSICVAGRPWEEEDKRRKLSDSTAEGRLEHPVSHKAFAYKWTLNQQDEKEDRRPFTRWWILIGRIKLGQHKGEAEVSPLNVNVTTTSK